MGFDWSKNREGGALWLISALSATTIAIRTGAVIAAGSSFQAGSVLLVVIIAAVWMAPGLVVVSRGPNSWPTTFTRGAALLSIYMAGWMLLGDPDMNGGGMWFAFVAFIYYAPAAMLFALTNAGSIVSALKLRNDHKRRRARTVLGIDWRLFTLLAIIGAFLLYLVVTSLLLL